MKAARLRLVAGTTAFAEHEALNRTPHLLGDHLALMRADPDLEATGVLVLQRDLLHAVLRESSLLLYFLEALRPFFALGHLTGCPPLLGLPHDLQAAQGGTEGRVVELPAKVEGRAQAAFFFVAHNQRQLQDACGSSGLHGNRLSHKYFGLANLALKDGACARPDCWSDSAS